MAQILPINNASIDTAAAVIRQGRLVAFGTETVYGLGGDACNDLAVRRIFTAKGRPPQNPLISHLPDAATAFLYAQETPLAKALAQYFWPGPMTLVLEQTATCPVSQHATAGLNTIAVRVPESLTVQKFIAACATPIAAPSANRSGRISPTEASHVVAELGGCAELALILDTGACVEGIESTVIDARAEIPEILRPGSITQAMIEAKIGANAKTDAVMRTPKKTISPPISPPISPGQMHQHYAPTTPLRLNQHQAGEDTIWIGFGNTPPPPCLKAFNLSHAGDLREAAAKLYATLRHADSMGAKAIAIAPIPNQSVGVAINDRLQRGAS